MFTGDTFYPGMMYAHFEDSDFGAYQQAAEYLVGLLPQVSHLCPAHSKAYVILAENCHPLRDLVGQVH